MTKPVSLITAEWQTVSPDPADPVGRKLVGVSLTGNPSARDLADELTRRGMLEVLELASGLRVRTTSFVGRVQLGPLQVTIRPKLPGPVLLTLLRYAYSLRNLRLVGTVDLHPGEITFPDLLIHQLVAEVSELISRGLHRKYIRQRAELPSPRGRIDFASLARRGSPASPALPCWYNPRLTNCLVNQVLLAGLRVAEGLAQDAILRNRVRRVATMVADEVTPVPLNRETFRQALMQTNRLTKSYRPALTLVEMLVAGHGLSTEPAPPHPRSPDVHVPRIPGHLFDMNRFFQAVVTRFLSDNLPGYAVHSECRVKGIFSYVRGYEAPGRGIPEPRPDIVITLLGSPLVTSRGPGALGPSKLSTGTLQAAALAVLDVKYRDLWQNPIPTDMLYQVAVYALSQPRGRAAIIYPTLSPTAREVRMEVRDPLSGFRKAEVALRPLRIDYLAELIQPAASTTAQQRREAYARYIAFSAETSPRPSS